MKDRYAQLDMATRRARAARRTYACTPTGPGEATRHVPVAIVGAGPVGLAAAAELAHWGVRSVVLERANTLSDGSRAICWAKRSLEICDRLGIAGRMLDKGITWNIGRVFHGADPAPLYSFDLLPDKAQKFPAFINLQQYYTEEYLIDSLAGLPTEIRWQHEVRDLRQDASGVELEITTAAGDYRLRCDYVIAADGCRSGLRARMGLDFDGRTFEDNFLIADVRVKAPFPAERHFYFNAPFNEGRTALMHQQPDDVWRLDFQLGWEIDREAALREENVTPKVRAMLGEDVDFDYEWVSIYTFQCRRMTDFRHGRVLFVGDAAHQVSPFGARGANSGFQDADDLMWKLGLVIKGQAPEKLLDTYAMDRQFAADENIMNSTRSTDFITPKSRTSKTFRNQVLALAKHYPFARKLVNSGRLSVPSFLTQSVLNTPDTDAFAGQMVPGAPMDDAPVQVGGNGQVQDAWLLDQVGRGFAALHFVDAAPDAQTLATLQALQENAVPVDSLIVSRQPLQVAGFKVLVDVQGWMTQRYDALPGTTYLLRPDQHVLARWRSLDGDRLQAAMARALARCSPQP